MLKLRVNYECILFFFTLNCILITLLEGISNETESNNKTETLRNSSIIFFHGLGDNGKSWSKMFSTGSLPNTHYIVPTAEKIPVTYWGRNLVYAWFDFNGPNNFTGDDEKGIEKSISFAHSLIDKEMDKGIPSTNIIVAGFSQGGALALLAGLKCNKKLAGIVAISSWLPLYDKFSESWVTHNRDIPILLCHGSNDTIIPSRCSVDIANKVKTISKNVSFKLYRNLTHALSIRMMRDVYNFVKLQLFGPLYGNLF